MRNIKEIAKIIPSVKHADKLRIASITDYKSNVDMGNTGSQPARQAASEKKERSQQTKMNDVEEQRLHDLGVRFQEVVVARNARLKQKSLGNIEKPDLVHAGLIALERLKNDEDFYQCVVSGKNRL